VYTVLETIRVHYRKKGQAKVLRDEIIELEYNPEDEDRQETNQGHEASSFKKGLLPG